MSRRPSAPSKVNFRWLAVIGLAAGTIIMFGGVYWWLGLRPRISPDDVLKKARIEQKQGRFAAAESLALRALQLDPKMDAAAVLAGECASAQSAWVRALDHFGRASLRSTRLKVSVRLREAEILHLQLHQLAKAELAYRTVLDLDSDQIDANAGLAQLLSLCGRKREAIPLILRLIRQDVETDMLVLLVRDDMVVDDVKLLTQAKDADPSDPNPLVGLAWHAIQKDQFAEAESLLKTSLGLDSQHVPAQILSGRLLLAVSRTTDFADWISSLPSSAVNAPDVWLIRGQMAEVVGDGRGAIRCFWEALRRAPENKNATIRLVDCLAAERDTRAGEGLRDRLTKMQALEEMQLHVVLGADRGRTELLWPLAQAYESAGRLWEAYAWCQFAINIGTGTPASMSYFERLRKIVQNEPLQLVSDAANIARTVDLSDYPIPDFHGTPKLSSNTETVSSAIPTFRDDAKAAGLNFQYFNGVNGPPTHRMFEFTGGGVGVLDFDLDSHPDLYLTQGCSWPPGSVDISMGDRLFRNHTGIAFDDVTADAGILEKGFGQGVTVGDFDGDGFPDLYIANIGRNQLWQNHGDGTFVDVTDSVGIRTSGWTSSAVLVDLTGDGLPEIYDSTYAGDRDVFDRICFHTDRSPMLCAPFDFHGQADRLWKNLGDGRFEEATIQVLGEVPLGMGFGVAAWDADGDGRLSLFVANDTTPCFFFRPESTGKGSIRLRNGATESGVAFNGAGKTTGCMGIAVGDIDDNGSMDFLITNFYAESNTLFINTAPGFFEDQTRRFGLEVPSFNLLGFGTQFLDADLDGRLELFVANGHVDDLSRLNRPYRMPAQLFQLVSDGRFIELPKERLGPYFESQWLGRPVARIDWNRDGRDDLVIGHLYDPVAILSNTTASVGHHLSIRLFGVQSNRDAIGTTIQARLGSRTITRQLIAGDGYQCSNERRISFGTGQATQIDELVVRWPSGLVQRFDNVAVPAEILLREGSVPIEKHSEESQ